MRIEIDDIKFWMDAVRNSKDRDRTLESFWGGQLKSKEWLIDHLEKHCRFANARVLICGGWNGVLASMLFNSKIGIKHITSLDIDPNCQEVANTINKRQEMDMKFTAVTEDMLKYNYKELHDNVIINTSCEHLTQTKYRKWLNSLPHGNLVVLQSNNYKELDEHVNCVDSIEEFKRKSRIDVTWEGELELPKYKRFMLIGRV